MKKVKWEKVWDNYNGMDRYLSKGRRFEINNYDGGEVGDFYLLDHKKKISYQLSDDIEAMAVADAIKNKCKFSISKVGTFDPK